MAEAAVLTSLGWLASPSMKLLFEKAFNHLGTGLDERRELLESTVLPRLSLAIEKAEKSPNKQKVEGWFKRLKNAYYEAEDAIDLFEYELLKKKVREDRKALQLKMKNNAGTRLSSPSQFVPQRLKIASSKLNNALSVFSSKKIVLKNCIDKLIKIGMEANEFRDLLEAQENSTWSDRDKDTISKPPALFFGREVDKETIVTWVTEKPLNSESGPSRMQQPIPIIAIMGRSGVGKTALAQYIYKCMEEQKHFDQPLWVHAPRIFKADDVIKNMIKTIKAEKGALHECNYDPSTPLEALSRETDMKMLGSKKFLLVLDDFWCDTQDFGEQWEKFISCMGSCVLESRILLTTQCASVKSKACINGLTKVTTHTLEDLENNKFWELFMHHAWPSGCFMQRDEFEGVSRKIAAKLKGDPGAAKLLGRQLSENIDLKYWEEVAEKDWLGDSMKARIWSYKQLPVDLQRCFTFLSLFPKGQVLHKYTLAHYWMAEGFTKSTHEEATLKDICDNYVGELVSRFFLEQQADNKGVYMHDLFHDLAKQVRGDEFITITCDNFIKTLSGSKTKGIRHIYLLASMINKLRDEMCLMKNLCTLIVVPDTTVSKEVLQQLFKQLKKLQLIELRSVDDLPDSIGNLKHLRYLCTSKSLVLKRLPNSICKLYHLQTLLFENCESLPENFCELISLRHFITKDMKLPIFNVGRLTSLQIFEKFIIKKESGHELHQLENLNQLQEKLHIIGLENVVNIEDATQANLRVKSHLPELRFEWRSNERAIDDFQLLDALQPHPNISSLTIKGYRGSRLPKWILQQNSFKDLTTLLLLECNEVEQISPISESIPSCKTLQLSDLIKLKELPPLPSNLTSLVLAGIPQLSFFSQEDLFGKQERIETILEVMKQIIKFVSSRKKLCDELIKESMQFLRFVKERLEAAQEISTMDLHYQSMFSETMRKINSGDLSPDQYLDAWVMGMQCHLELMFMNKNKKSELVLPSSLTNLWLGSCSITNDALSTGMQSLVFLSVLAISKIQTITSLPAMEVFCALKNLQSLTIEECYLLCSLGGIGALTSLTYLKLERCLNLDAPNEPLPSSLRKLEFQLCKNAHVILGNSHLPTLSDLILVAVRNEMVDLHVGHLSSLERLVIACQNCQLEGLSSLYSLHRLTFMSTENPLTTPVDKYSSPLQYVAVANPSHLKLMLSDETISSIEKLSIYRLPGESLNYEVFSSLNSLRRLKLSRCEITHLPGHIKNLKSLHYMYLNDCTGDLNPSDLEDLNHNLCELGIENCPTLMKSKEVGRPYHVRFEEGYTVLRFLTKDERKQSK